MPRIIQYIAIAILLIYAQTTFALAPKDGWWWDPSAPGTGFNIETQNATMSVAAYLFAESGEPVWWLAAGEFDASTGVFEAELDGFSGGQCQGCPSGEPAIDPAAGGTVRIQFHDATTATLDWPGDTIDIERLNFSVGSGRDAILGQWHFSSNTFGLVDGFWLEMNGKDTDSQGDPIYEGHTIEIDFDDSPTEGRQLAGFIGQRGLYWTLIDSTTSFFQLYAMNLTKDRVEGRQWLFRKENDPSGDGHHAFGARIASRSFALNGAGPNRWETTEPEIDFGKIESVNELKDQLLSARVNLEAGAPSPKTVSIEGKTIQFAKVVEYTQKLKRALERHE